MAAYFPQHKSAMMDINGIGSVKFDKYGEIFLKYHKRILFSHEIEEKIKNQPVVQNHKKEYRYKIIGDEFNKGCTISDLMNEFDIKTQYSLQSSLRLYFQRIFHEYRRHHGIFGSGERYCKTCYGTVQQTGH